MNKSGPIVIIEDDRDDQEIFSMAFQAIDVKNELMFFSDGLSAHDYLMSKVDFHPFLIISDINLPRMDGFKLRDLIRADAGMDRICVPFIFFSTAVSEKSVVEAYEKSVQGFFIKPGSFDQLTLALRSIVDYWKICYSPSNFYALQTHDRSNVIGRYQY